MKDQITSLLSLPALALAGLLIAVANSAVAAPSWSDVSLFFYGVTALAVVGLAWNTRIFLKTWKTRRAKYATMTLVYSGVSAAISLGVLISFGLGSLSL